MPQIAQLGETFASQIFWMLIVFGLVYFIVGRGIVPQVQGTVDDRNARISGDLEAAEAARADADRIEEEWRAKENAARAAAQARIAAARSNAAEATAVMLARAGSETDAHLAAAEARIEAAKQAAVAEIETVVTEAAQDIVARLSGAQVNEAEVRSAVKAALSHG